MVHSHHTLKRDLTRTILTWSVGFFALLGIVFLLSFNSLQDYVLELIAENRLSYQAQEFSRHLDLEDRSSIREESDAIVQEPVVSAILLIDASGELLHVSLSGEQPKLVFKAPLTMNSIHAVIDSHSRLHLFTRKLPGHNQTLALVLDDHPVALTMLSVTVWTLLLMIMLIICAIMALHHSLNRQLVKPIEKLRTAVEDNTIEEEQITLLEAQFPDEASEILELFDQLRHSRDDLRLHLMAMLDALPACFWWSSNGIHYDGISIKSEQVFGVESEHLKKASLWAWTGNSEQFRANTAQLQQAISKHIEHLDLAYQAELHGQTIWLGESITICYDRDSNIEAVYGIISDISIRKKQQQKQAEQLEMMYRMESTSTMVGGIAHEFNNVLAGMNGYLFLLKQETSSTASLNRIDRLEQLIERAAAMIERMLIFSHKSIDNPSHVQMFDFLNNLQRLLTATLPEHIALSFDLPDEDPDEMLVVVADQKRLHEVFMQLVENAVQAMDCEKPAISISMQAIEADSSLLRKHASISSRSLLHIEVRDNGTGIDPALHSRIFEPFFSTREIGKGTGLGLSMVYGYMHQIGGAISVESMPGEGTAFDLYLPRIMAEKPTESDGPVLHGNGELILVVDDEKVFVESTGEVLSRMGYKIITAENGHAAIEVFREHRNSIQLILMDMMMPGMGGVEASRQIRKLQPDVPIIFVTAYDQSQPMDPGIYNDHCALINKPFSFSRLSQTIRKELDKRK